MARTHFGAQRAILEALERYYDNPRVSIILRENVGGKLRSMGLKTFVERLYESIDCLQELGQRILDETRDTKDLQRPAGGDDTGGSQIPFPITFYEAARSKAQSGRKAANEGDARGLSESGKKSK